MMKIFLSAFVACFVILTAAGSVANAAFSTDSNISYLFNEEGEASVTNSVTITNTDLSKFPLSYELKFNNLSPLNLKVYEDGALVSSRIEKNSNQTVVFFDFENESLGLGSKKTFLITYSLNNLALKKGETWEVNIPKPQNSHLLQSYEVVLEVPSSWGVPSFYSVNPTLFLELFDKNKIVFGVKSDNFQNNLYLTFGNLSIYDFSISYHLENPLNKEAFSQVAFIPDTSFQSVYYDEISPKPERMYRDRDGNLIALYKFESRELKDILIKGKVEVFGQSIRKMNFDSSYLVDLTKSQPFWETDSEVVSVLANNLKTPRGIYDYIVANFDYSQDRIKDTKFERRGAVNALLKPSDNLCSEFTDAFVALSRGIKVPTREINGFGFSDNKPLYPSSLVTDILHAWPEYWDSEKQEFVPIDPTWGKTSQRDYYSNFDTKHIAFSIHGVSSKEPFSAGTYKLSSHPQNDVKIALSENPDEKEVGFLDISYSFERTLSPFSKILVVELKNMGGGTVYNLSIDLKKEEKNLYREEMEYLLPLSQYTYKVNIPVNLFDLGASNIELITKTNTTLIPLDFTSEVRLQVAFFLLMAILLCFILLKRKAFFRR